MAGDDPVPADRLFETVVGRFQTMRPGAQVRLEFASAPPPPQIVGDMALQQAVINLLSNAAYVSPLDVCLSVAWDERELHLVVSDRGPGFPPELAARLGQACVTGKPPGEGCGVGLFLTQVTINRLHGRLQLSNAPEGGAVASICVPLSALRKRNLADG
jgi:two-component system sensor histidine kinase RegB